MFAVAVAYNGLAPALCETRYGEVAWDMFFRAVKDNRPATAVFRGPNYSTYRVEFEKGNFYFSGV